MKVKLKPRAEPEIIITSLIDIAVLLLIFFILTTTMAKMAGEKLTIPSGSSDASKKQDKQATIGLKPGEIRYGEKSELITLADLRNRLAQEAFLAKDPAQRVVILDSDPRVLYDEYYQVVMAIARAGGVVALVDQEEEAATGGTAPAKEAAATAGTAPTKEAAAAAGAAPVK